MADYIPRNDAEFNVWQSNLVAITEPNVEAWGILADDLSSLKTGQAAWEAAFAKANNRQNRTSADVQAKNDARKSYEKQLRSFVGQWLSNNSKVPDSERERMGLTVKTGARIPVSTPETSPGGTIDFSVRLQHSIHFYDETTPTSKAKPEGVHGCQVWMKIGGEPPVDASELTFVATDTRTPYIYTFDGQQVGQTVYYRLRWVNTRGETGPWSSIISAVVAG